MRISILIPAAGASRRMRGRDKLLEQIDGVPLLRRQVARAIATGWPVVVCVRADVPERMAALDGLDTRLVQVSQPEAGMSVSLREGMAQINDTAEAVMILPADMPDLNTDDFKSLARQYAGMDPTVLRATSANGTPGHPVIFPRRLFDKLRALPDGEGARHLLEHEDVALCTLPGERAVTDLDTPEDWALWRQSH